MGKVIMFDNIVGLLDAAFPKQHLLEYSGQAQ